MTRMSGWYGRRLQRPLCFSTNEKDSKGRDSSNAECEIVISPPNGTATVPDEKKTSAVH